MASAMTSSMSTQILLRLMTLLSAMHLVRGTGFEVRGGVRGAKRETPRSTKYASNAGYPNRWLERADDLGGYGFYGDGGFALWAVAGGVVVEHAAAVFAAEDGVGGFGVGAVVAEVVPALRADHHLAGGALLVEGFGDGGSLGAGDAVVVGEGGFAGFTLGDLGAQGQAADFEFGEGGLVVGDDFGGASTFALEGGGGLVNGGVGQRFLGVEGFAALHAVELLVLEAGDLGADEGGFVLEGFELVRGGGHVELLLVALELDAEVGDLGFFLAAEGLFLGDEVEDDGALADGGLGLGFERGDLFGERGHLVAQVFGFEVVGLQDDEVGEIRMHVWPSFSAGVS